MSDAFITKTPSRQKDKEMDGLKLPPYSKEAEQSVLGAVMLDASAWDKICDKVSSVDFYLPAHKLIYEALCALSEKSKPLDMLTTSEYLKNHNQLAEIGGEMILYALAKNTPSVANVSAYADIIRERSVLRQLIEAAGDIAHLAHNPKNANSVEILDEAERKVFAIAEQGPQTGGPESIKTLLAKAVDRIDTLFHTDEPITGLPTGFDDFDDMTSGLQPADLVIVAGRPSMGKTLFGMNLVEYAAIKRDCRVAVFSMEMPGEALAVRLLSSLGRIDQLRLRTGKLEDEDWASINSAVNLISNAGIFIDDTPALSPAEIRARARRLVKEHGKLDLIMVDYLQLMQVPGMRDNRVQEVSEISRNLKALAKELNVPVVALSQLNRGLESRTDKRPVMADLRESGAIEQDADLIAFIYRDEVYNPESPDKGTAEIIIGKQRNGPIGSIRLGFFGRFARFENLARDTYGDEF
jgi:replicative DNA helicase